MSQSLCPCSSWCRDTSILVYILVIFFGVASWVDINGLWVELPILVQRLPEGWDLPSYMAVIIQVANVAPLAYTVSSAVWPHRRIEVPVIFVIISVGAVSCLLLALFWDFTATLPGGAEHSVALLTLQFFLALVDCTSSVAFLPFMSIFKPRYMVAYFIGEGFSGLIPSLVSLGQGAGSMECVKVPTSSAYAYSSTITQMPIINVTDSGSHNPFNGTLYNETTQLLSVFNASVGAVLHDINNRTSFDSNVHSVSPATTDLVQSYPIYKPPRFTVQVFFLFLMCLMITSLLSFTLLNYWSYCKKEYVAKKSMDTRGSSRRSSSTLYHDESNDVIEESDVLTTSAMLSTHSTTKEILTSELDENRYIAEDNKYTNNQNAIIIDDNLSYNKNEMNDTNHRIVALNTELEQQSGLNILVSFPERAEHPESRKLCCNETFKNTENVKSLGGSSSLASDLTDDPKKEMVADGKRMSRTKYAIFILLTAWVNALVCGLLPAIQTYSCLPYGIRPFHLSVTLSSIANPVACLASVFLTMTSIRMTLFTTAIGSGLSGYLIFTAAMSPSPPLVYHSAGGYLVILAWVVTIFFLVYTKVSMGLVFRREGRSALLWVGAATQVGALVGALTIFFIINYYHLFQWANPCLG